MTTNWMGVNAEYTVHRKYADSPSCLIRQIFSLLSTNQAIRNVLIKIAHLYIYVTTKPEHVRSIIMVIVDVPNVAITYGVQISHGRHLCF